MRENEKAGHLDLLGASCRMLARTAMITSPAGRRMLAPSVRDLAGALVELAKQPGDPSVRQAAVNLALDGARRVVASDVPPDSPLAAAIINVRMVTADIMICAGVDPDQAGDAVRDGTGQLPVPTPPRTPTTPFTPRRWRRDR